MAFHVNLRPEAKQDLREAKRWYNDQRKGLGREFVLEVDGLLLQIQNRPRLNPKTYGEVRQALVKRFPSPSAI